MLLISGYRFRVDLNENDTCNLPTYFINATIVENAAHCAAFLTIVLSELDLYERILMYLVTFQFFKHRNDPGF